MRLMRFLSLLLLILALGAGTVHADYLASKDTTVSLTLAPSLLSTSSWSGSTTFQLQESVHEALTSSTGAEVDHYYLWVDVNGEPVLAVDPMCGYDFKR